MVYQKGDDNDVNSEAYKISEKWNSFVDKNERWIHSAEVQQFLKDTWRELDKLKKRNV